MKVDILHDGGRTPIKSHPTDAGWDLFVSRTVTIPPGMNVDVHTDIYVNIPRGLYGRITGRSSTLRKHHLLVNEGIIDCGYTGELYICVHNMGNEPFKVRAGMRLAQIIFGEVIPIEFKTVDCLPGTNRGTNGFGSTGV